MLSLKTARGTQPPCKICGGATALFGTVDFNRPCQIPDAVRMPALGAPVRHYRCEACGFLFTDAFDDWTHADFQANIYNDDYIKFDPDYREARPYNNAIAVVQLFGTDREHRRVLDFGGGNDVLCTELRKAGFSVAVTYDPFVPDHAAEPEGTFDLITCFETLEHMPDPLTGIGLIAGKLADPGLVLFSTLLQPDNIKQLGTNWWYIGPRNGHVSMFSRDALAKAWARYGCQTGSFDANMHIAFRTLPDYAKYLINK